LDKQGGRWARWRRPALVAAPIAALIVALAALALWPEPKARPPRPVAQVDPTPPPPLAVTKPKPEKKPKRPPRPEKRRPKRELRVKIDRNAASPVAVSVPSVGISAPVVPLKLKSNGKLEVPTDFSKAGWRQGGPEPGERGAAMITGHVDSKSGPAAFYRLREVGSGADIRVRRKDGSTVAFVAERSERVPKDSFPTKRVYGKTRLPTLRLVTCGGSFDSAAGHYRDNVIVYATRKPS